MEGTTYCLDTSSAIFAYSSLRPSTFQNLWAKIEAMFSAGSIFIPEEVLRELSAQTDETYKYFKAKQAWIVPLDPYQIAEARRLINQYPNMVNVNTWKNSADPFVVALAKIRKAKVITQETVKSEDQLKLPNVCRWHEVVPLNFHEFLDEQNWDL